MWIWEQNIRAWHVLLLCIITSLQVHTAGTLIPVKSDHTCSSRPAGSCVSCDGVPECFDLSDEIGCPNTTLSFIPIRQAAQTCSQSKCLHAHGFPEPPPLPPFSLCKIRHRPTSPLPITTARTEQVTTSKPVTPIPTTSSSASLPVTTKLTPITDSTVTYFPTRETTPAWSKSTKQWPFFTTPTSPPPWSTTRKFQTTTAYDIFMEYWWRCASWYHSNSDIYSCVLRFFQGDNSSDCHGCFGGINLAFDPVHGQTPPSTATNNLFNPMPTQLFQTMPPTTRPPVLYTDLVGFQSQSNSNEITEQDMMHLYMLMSHFNK